MPQARGTAVKARVRALEMALTVPSIPQKMRTLRWDHRKEHVHTLQSGRKPSLRRKNSGTAGNRIRWVGKAICVDRETRSLRAPFLETYPEWRGMPARRTLHQHAAKARTRGRGPQSQA